MLLGCPISDLPSFREKHPRGLGEVAVGELCMPHAGLISMEDVIHLH